MTKANPLRLRRSKRRKKRRPCPKKRRKRKSPRRLRRRRTLLRLRRNANALPSLSPVQATERNGPCLRTTAHHRRRLRPNRLSKPNRRRNTLCLLVGPCADPGNMSFDVTADMLAKHFAETCGETPKVRLLTKRGDPRALEGLSKSKQKSIAKGKARDPSAPVSKGCAFAEFAAPTALQKALRFHHSQFHGRQINVELTAGGGGTGQQRQEKIKAKNAELEKERVGPPTDAAKTFREACQATGGRAEKDAVGKSSRRAAACIVRPPSCVRCETGQVCQWIEQRPAWVGYGAVCAAGSHRPGRRQVSAGWPY